MPLRSNGRLLIRSSAPQELARALTAQTFSPGDLSDGYSIHAIHPSLPDWHILTPATFYQQPPWDAAHAAAKAIAYDAYVEPDIFHEPLPGASAAIRKFQKDLNQPPPDADTDGFTPTEDDPLQDVATYGPSADTQPVSPGWHLESGRTGFLDVRGLATGLGIRIAHIDTGYTPDHASTPEHICDHLARDFWLAASIEDGRQGAVDPGTQIGKTMQPGHGTATLALLAGNNLKLKWGTKKFEGFFGGAPQASIIPIRIGPTVYHVYSSALAFALCWALKPSGNAAMQADVVSLSHGGLPSQIWADAVNALYNAGTVIVASSGDWFHEWIVDVPMHYTIYPAAFNRVITAVGMTFNNGGYQTKSQNVMQGSFGPHDVMEKAAAAFTPNVAWMDYRIHNGGSKSAFSMSGGGTSSSTPQIAAACALWLERHKDGFQKGWKRVEACRLALFDSCRPPLAPGDMLRLGQGSLSVPDMLSQVVLDRVNAAFGTGYVKPMPQDEVNFPLWRLLLGADPPGADVAAKMYETEVAQIVRSSTNPMLQQAEVLAAQRVPFDPSYRAKVVGELLKEPISGPLTAMLQTIR